jgi:hypothetical protein
MSERTYAWPNDLNFVAYGQIAYNPRHTAIRWLIQCGAACALRVHQKNGDSAELKALAKALTAVCLDDLVDEDERAEVPARWAALQEAASKLPELATVQPVPLPSIGDYVPGTLVADADGPEFANLEEIFSAVDFKEPFGADWKP